MTKSLKNYLPLGRCSNDTRNQPAICPALFWKLPMWTLCKVGGGIFLSIVSKPLSGDLTMVLFSPFQFFKASNERPDCHFCLLFVFFLWCLWDFVYNQTLQIVSTLILMILQRKEANFWYFPSNKFSFIFLGMPLMWAFVGIKKKKKIDFVFFYLHDRKLRWNGRYG